MEVIIKEFEQEEKERKIRNIKRKIEEALSIARYNQSRGKNVGYQDLYTNDHLKIQCRCHIHST